MMEEPPERGVNVWCGYLLRLAKGWLLAFLSGVLVGLLLS